MISALQEVACNHIQSLGFSTDGFGMSSTMRKMNLVWVTARMHIEIYKYPAWNDVVEIETWFHKEDRIGTRQDWILKDYANGQVIGRATSKRVMMNQETRRLQKVNDDILDEYLIFCQRESSSSNQHVNNVTYIGWVLESMPREIIDSYELQTITLDYRRECQHDNVVDSLSSHEPDENLEAISQLNGTNGSAKSPATVDYRQFLHLLRFSGDGLEINRGRTQWRKKPVR
ncbi:hypothetical protein EUGRSUZ_H00771 [Eucalyptus grandis]|uniref:Uncharacterized protein n=2 Tax=Eucalyptus grandis TaxID=71139 RepID=A0ACC3JND8_EUCGR|nr:hypothetical protein EUGRSUZ_H00771 [Eucalyptus grandis]